VVGRAGSGLTEFISHGTEGLLCESDVQMVRSLKQLVLNEHERIRISEHNRTVASVLTWTAALDAHEDVYERAGTRSAPGIKAAERLGIDLS
jgi:phosphatidylinositol alpha 1,6-mannosyltransferase